jgi:hypothetical protein
MYRSTSPDDDISATTPHSSSSDGSRGAEAEKLGEPLQFEPLQFNWSALVLLIHPMKTAIIEAMCWVDDPLSANLISRMTGGRYSLQYVSYHVKSLADAGLIVEVAQRPVRGAMEHLYRVDPRLVE